MKYYFGYTYSIVSKDEDIVLIAICFSLWEAGLVELSSAFHNSSRMHYIFISFHRWNNYLYVTKKRSQKRQFLIRPSYKWCKCIDDNIFIPVVIISLLWKHNFSESHWDHFQPMCARAIAHTVSSMTVFIFHSHLAMLGKRK